MSPLRMVFFFLFSLAFVLGEGRATPLHFSPVEGRQERDLLHGDKVDLSLVASGESKKGLVLIFLSAQCPCSHDHSPHLKELKKAFPDFTFVGIHSNQDEPEALYKKYFQTLKLNFPVIHDEKGLLADKLGALKTPHSFVIGKGGDILFQGGVTNSVSLGRANKFFLKTALEEVQSGKTPQEALVKTVGCYISR